MLPLGTGGEAAKAPAAVAKERLQIILSQQRGQQMMGDAQFQKMQSQILQVVGQYWKVDSNDINCTVRPSVDNADMEVFEMQVQLPQRSRNTTTNPTTNASSHNNTNSTRNNREMRL